MIEIDEAVYAQLQKDANDNKSILRLVRVGCIFIFLLIILIMYASRIIDISLENYRASVECRVAIIQAENNVRVREIESAGMTNEEYIKWLEVRATKDKQ